MDSHMFACSQVGNPKKLLISAQDGKTNNIVYAIALQ